jgi:hypothetical protein
VLVAWCWCQTTTATIASLGCRSRDGREARGDGGGVGAVVDLCLACSSGAGGLGARLGMLYVARCY